MRWRFHISIDQMASLPSHFSLSRAFWINWCQTFFIELRRIFQLFKIIYSLEQAIGLWNRFLLDYFIRLECQTPDGFHCRRPCAIDISVFFLTLSGYLKRWISDKLFALSYIHHISSIFIKLSLFYTPFRYVPPLSHPCHSVSFSYLLPSLFDNYFSEVTSPTHWKRPKKVKKNALPIEQLFFFCVFQI